MDAGWTNFVIERLPDLWLRTGEHVILTGFATGIAIVIGIPLGIVASRVSWLRGPLLGAVGILQTIPSLAMLALLLALIQKIGTLPAIIALTLYALLPIVRNSLTGIEGVPDRITEAARGIGMTDHQQLLMVRLPLALPVIVAGVRTAAVVGVGIATLSAFIGAGGLGQFINRGLALASTPLILMGAIPAALLALVVDFSVASAEWGLRPTRESETHPILAKLKPIAVFLPVLVLLAGVAAYFTRPTSGVSKKNAAGAAEPAGTVRVGTKNFTEQFILGELMAQLIETNTNLNVKRRFNLGGTMICHGALENGEIDLYAEYTGTGLTAILKQETIADPEKALDVVRKAYEKQFNTVWLEPFGFNNTYAITVRKSDAEQKGWQTIADLEADAAELKAGFTSEFAERPDGYRGLQEAYGFRFGEMVDLDPSIMYQAIDNGQVDVICAFATDGRIPAYDLQPLEDNLGFFPPYYAAPVVRRETLEAYPAIGDALAELAGLLDDQTMQHLNYQVDLHKRDAAVVAREFLEENEWIAVKTERAEEQQ